MYVRMQDTVAQAHRQGPESGLMSVVISLVSFSASMFSMICSRMCRLTSGSS